MAAGVLARRRLRPAQPPLGVRRSVNAPAGGAHSKASSEDALNLVLVKGKIGRARVHAASTPISSGVTLIDSEGASR